MSESQPVVKNTGIKQTSIGKLMQIAGHPRVKKKVLRRVLLSWRARFSWLSLFLLLGGIVSDPSISSAGPTPVCAEILAGKDRSGAFSDSGLTEVDFLDHVSKKIMEVPEFQYIREQAQKMGLRVWLFGGTASSFLHYVKWDLAREKGLMDLQKDRFDYDFTNIFRSTQDLDIVVDASPEVAGQFQSTIAQRYPHFLGSKANKWEVRTLKQRMGSPGEFGFKEALLNDSDFNDQNTDSNSLGMVEVTKSQEPVVRDLKHWEGSKSLFLEDVLNNRISFLRSVKHFKTSRAKLGENPEILAVIRLLVKAFQYELEFSKSDFDQMTEVVREFDPKQVKNVTALRRINDSAKKLVMHAVDVEYAMDRLDELGLRQKLIAMGDKSEEGSTAWWLNREPLRSKPIEETKTAAKRRNSLRSQRYKMSGAMGGKTAEQLDIKIVAHETNSFLAYESITRSHSGEPNVLISRKNAVGEGAEYEDGFYTRLGKEGAAGTGLTIRFTVDPRAREGLDFMAHGDYIVFKNKKALTVIQESLNLGLDDLMRLAESNEDVQIYKSDMALLEKLKRRLNAALISDELEKLLHSRRQKDQDRLIQILGAFQDSAIARLISEDVLVSVAKRIFEGVSGLSRSTKEEDLLRYVKTVGAIIKTIDKSGALTIGSFFEYLKAIAQRGGASPNLRKQAAFELLLLDENPERGLRFKPYLPESQIQEVASEVRGWHRSKDARRRKFVTGLSLKWQQALEQGRLQDMQALIASGLFDVNFRDVSGVSGFLRAIYNNQRNIIDWFIQNPEYDLNGKNKWGYTEVEQLKLLGKEQLAREIEGKRPEVVARDFKPHERNLDGTPIIDFVKMEGGSFMMGEGSDKVLTTLTKPFEIMSIKTTQATYRAVVKLLKKKFSGEYRGLKANPSYFRGDMNPVEQVSYYDVALWNKGLNQLSQLDDPQVQQTLMGLFPGHQKNAKYRLPTEAEWDYVAGNQGMADGLYSHENSDAHLSEYAWFNGKGRDSTTHPVGEKKPIFVNGKPIYDLHGNVNEWVADWHEFLLTGGIDPQGPRAGSNRVIRGGAWHNDAQSLRSAHRDRVSPGYGYAMVGFRLVRTMPQ